MRVSETVVFQRENFGLCSMNNLRCRDVLCVARLLPEGVVLLRMCFCEGGKSE